MINDKRCTIESSLCRYIFLLITSSYVNMNQYFIIFHIEFNTDRFKSNVHLFHVSFTRVFEKFLNFLHVLN